MNTQPISQCILGPPQEHWTDSFEIFGIEYMFNNVQEDILSTVPSCLLVGLILSRLGYSLCVVSNHSWQWAPTLYCSDMVPLIVKGIHRHCENCISLPEGRFSLVLCLSRALNHTDRCQSSVRPTLRPEYSHLRPTLNKMVVGVENGSYSEEYCHTLFPFSHKETLVFEERW